MCVGGGGGNWCSCVFCVNLTKSYITHKYHMCGYIHADVNVNLGGPAKVKCKSKSTELYADKAGPPIVRLFNFQHFISHSSPFSLTVVCWI